MKKLLTLCLSLLLLTTACTPQPKIDIAMVVAEKSTAVNNFHQNAWSAIEKFQAATGRTIAHYAPENRALETQLASIEQAIQDGAKLLILPGYLLEHAAFETQAKHPETTIILVDSTPSNGLSGRDRVEAIAAKTYALLFAEEQAGYLAGYAAVRDGYTKLGFFGGMSVPTVTRFGYGFIQGAEYAAQQLNLPDASIELKYIYCGSFSAAPEFQARAATWYLGGTEVIFACGGGMGASVIQAANTSESGLVIGVDADQSADSPRVLTSAIKLIEPSVYAALEAYQSGTFPGGQALHLGTATQSIGLPMSTSRFRTFTQTDYDTIYQRLATDEGGLASSILKDNVDILDIPTRCVTVLLEHFR